MRASRKPIAGLALLALMVSPIMAQNPPEEPAPRASHGLACDADCLRGMVDEYLAAVAAHDPGRLPLAKRVRFTEMGQQLELGDGFWHTASAVGRYKHYFPDPEAGEIGFIHMKLRLWASAQDASDMDLFVAVQKLDARGEIVGFPFWAHFDAGPVALGWLRATHRELDEARSTPWQPVLRHARPLRLTPGEPTPMEIEIWPHLLVPVIPPR